MPIVYAAINSVNSKCYIGVTSRTLAHRRRQHINSVDGKGGYCRVFCAALKKYGPDAFTWIILHECASYKDALAEEVRLIAQMNPEYNITSGGQGMPGLVRTPEWIEKVSKALKGRKKTEAERIKIKECARPEAHYKPVTCLDDGKWFESMKACAEHYGISSNGIGEVLAGRQATSSGLAFAFTSNPIADEERLMLLKFSKDRKKRNRDRVLSGCMRSRPVKCVNDGKVYSSGKAAAEAYGVARMTISIQCRRGGQTLSGLRFMFADAASAPVRRQKSAEEMRTAMARRDAGLKRAAENHRKKVICLCDGLEFNSLTEASAHAGVSISSVTSAINRGGRSGGKRFSFAKAA
jgi:osmotically-inducible protein OsmY